MARNDQTQFVKQGGDAGDRLAAVPAGRAERGQLEGEEGQGHQDCLKPLDGGYGDLDAGVDVEGARAGTGPAPQVTLGPAGDGHPQQVAFCKPRIQFEERVGRARPGDFDDEIVVRIQGPAEIEKFDRPVDVCGQARKEVAEEGCGGLGVAPGAAFADQEDATEAGEVIAEAPVQVVELETRPQQPVFVTGACQVDGAVAYISFYNTIDDIGDLGNVTFGIGVVDPPADHGRIELNRPGADGDRGSVVAGNGHVGPDPAIGYPVFDTGEKLLPLEEMGVKEDNVHGEGLQDRADLFLNLGGIAGAGALGCLEAAERSGGSIYFGAGPEGKRRINVGGDHYFAARRRAFYRDSANCDGDRFVVATDVERAGPVAAVEGAGVGVAFAHAPEGQAQRPLFRVDDFPVVEGIQKIVGVRRGPVGAKLRPDPLPFVGDDLGGVLGAVDGRLGGHAAIAPPAFLLRA